MPQEKEIGAWYTIDISLTINDCSCATSDDITGTVSYADVYETICEEMSTPSELLENVCQRISQKLYGKFAQIESINICLCKDTPPMGGDRLKAAVTLKSKR
jgi:dihydroneopterin aldolase